jgi:hypothetical protein
VIVTIFHIQDGLLCHLGHICVPASEREKMIWESHYSSMAGHFGMEKTLTILHKKKIIGQNFDKTSASISYLALLVSLQSHP